MRRTLVFVVALAMVVAACGGGGEDAEALSDAIADAMMENVGEDSPFDREQADCFGDEAVDRLGVDRLVAVGLSVEALEGGAELDSVDLTDDDIDKMTDAVTECIDFGRLVVDELTAEFTLSDESADCLVDGINEGDFLRDVAGSAFLGESDTSDLEGEMAGVLFGLLGECLSADELGGFLGG